MPTVHSHSSSLSIEDIRSMKKLLSRIGGREEASSRKSTPATSDKEDPVVGLGEACREDWDRHSPSPVLHNVNSYTAPANETLKQDGTGLQLLRMIDTSAARPEPDLAPNECPAVMITPAQEVSPGDHRSRITKRPAQSKNEQ